MKRLSPESRRKSIQIIYFTAGKHAMERVCKKLEPFFPHPRNILNITQTALKFVVICTELWVMIGVELSEFYQMPEPA